VRVTGEEIEKVVNYVTPDAAQAYERHADMLYRIALGTLMSAHDAEDAVAEVFASFISRTQDFRDSEHEKAWFIRATVNKCRDIQRRRSVRSHSPIEDAAEIVDTDDGFAEMNGIMQDVLALPEKYKSVILLHYFEDLSVEETAKALSIGQSAVKMRLARARQMLKDGL